MKRDHPMTLKPPTKTFPKLVMKEWPDLEVQPEQDGSLTFTNVGSGPTTITREALSDFTRVLEGVEGQKRPQKEKSRDE